MPELISARPVALMRIIVGGAALIRSIGAFETLGRLREPEVVVMPIARWLSDPGTGLAVLALWVLGAIGLVLGWRTTLSGSALAAALGAYLAIDHQTYGNHLYLMLLLVILLVVADSGAALGSEEERQVATWPMTLIKIQASIVYGFAGLTKLNSEFLDGTVLAGSLGKGLIPVPEALVASSTMGILAIGAIVTELFLATALWRDRLRPTAIALGFSFHAAITLFMAPTVELFVFSLLMLSMYPLFLDRRPIAAVWDDDCSSCRDWIERFTRSDMLRLIEPVGKSDPSHGLDPHDVDHAMHTITPISTNQAFAATTDILERIVPTLWVAPFLRLPLVSTVGERWYRRQADRRSCSIA